MFYSQQLFRTAQAAHYLGLAKRTLEKRRCYGNSPPCFKLSNIVYYEKTELEEWAAANRRFNTSQTQSNSNAGGM